MILFNKFTRTILFCIAIIGFINGCTAISKNKITSKLFDVPKVPEPINLSSSAIAISVKFDSRTVLALNPLEILFNGGEVFNYEKVFFDKIFLIKLEGNMIETTQGKVYETNFAYKPAKTAFQFGSYDNFLMNVEPGTYAAVGGIGSGQNTRARFIVYFPDELIRSSITTVSEGSISYMGQFELERGYANKQMDSPDISQNFYFRNQIFPKKYLASKYIHYSPNLMMKNTGSETEQKYLFNILDTYIEPEWNVQIKNELSRNKLINRTEKDLPPLK